jgi:regulator of sirC expression with transglutaminase-like and TPR domain
MEATERFAALLGGPETEIDLDEAALLIAAHAHPGLDLDAQRARLDDLAATCPEATRDGLVRHLFVDLAFAGDRETYDDPDNSYLDRVLDRRLGIPITLSVLAIEVGRRLGVPLVGVGLPGHFIVRDALDEDAYLDPFHAGAALDRAGCEAVVERLHGGSLAFDPRFLDPVGPRAIVARMLANLKATFARRRDRASLLWVIRLRTLVPGVPPAERRELASVLAADGRFVEAAVELEDMADLDPSQRDALRAAARRLRARLN